MNFMYNKHEILTARADLFSTIMVSTNSLVGALSASFLSLLRDGVSLRELEGRFLHVSAVCEVTSEAAHSDTKASKDFWRSISNFLCKSQKDFARFNNFIVELKQLFLQTTVDLFKYAEAKTPICAFTTFSLRIRLTKSSITPLTSPPASDKTLLRYLESDN